MPYSNDRNIPADQYIKERIVVDKNGCWLWQNSLDKDGYGWCRSRKNRKLFNISKAHQLSYAVFVGANPDKLYVLHKCDVRNCVNPAHLFLGTQKENIEDMLSKGRQKPANKEQIAFMLANTHMRAEDVANTLHCSITYVYKIWKKNNIVKTNRKVPPKPYTHRLVNNFVNS